MQNGESAIQQIKNLRYGVWISLMDGRIGGAAGKMEAGRMPVLRMLHAADEFFVQAGVNAAGSE